MQTDTHYIQTVYQRFTLGFCGFLLSAILLIGVIVIALFSPDIFPQDQHFVVIPLAMMWIVLLRRYPRLWFRLRHDRDSLTISQCHGIAVIHNKPGFKILFSPSQQLSVAGKTFDLWGLPIEQLCLGSTVEVNYFTSSNVIASISKVEQNLEQHTSSMLTDLELAIVRLMAQGLSDKLIARELDLEPATVRTYNSTLYKKLAVSNRKQASKKAEEDGYLDVN